RGIRLDVREIGSPVPRRPLVHLRSGRCRRADRGGDQQKKQGPGADAFHAPCTTQFRYRAEFPDVSRGSGAPPRREHGGSLTGGSISGQPPLARFSGRRLTVAGRLTTVGPLRNSFREEPTDG